MIQNEAAPSIAARLRLAREALGLTLSQLSAASGLGVSSLSEFESGKREPRLVQLQKIARSLGQSLSFFLTDAAPAKEVVLWRSRPPEPMAVELEQKFLRWCKDFASLENWCGENSRPVLPEPTFHDAPEQLSYERTEGLAGQVRMALQLGARPGQSLLRVLEEVCRIKILHMTFDPTGSAACLQSEILGAGVALNSKHKKWRRNFDLAHELFHLVTWKLFKHSNGESLASEKEERLATCFARNLLVPREVLFADVTRTELEGADRLWLVRNLALEFEVSTEVILWQLHYVMNHPEVQTREDIEQVRRLGPIGGRSAEQDPPSTPDRYSELANRALREGQISHGKYAELMGISRRRALEALEEVEHEP